MTTDNKRVAAYLPQTLYDLLEGFKKENNLSESKAIISILAAHFGVAQEVSQRVAHQFVTIEKFDELQDKVAHLAELFSELEKRRDQAVQDSSLGELKSNSEEILHPGQKTIFEVTESLSKNELKDELKSNSLEPRGAKELAERFPDIRNYQSITNKKNKFRYEPEKFVNWARKYDKDQIGWMYNEVDKLYHSVP